MNTATARQLTVESAITVVPFSREYSDSWDAYVKSSPEGTLFHLRSWGKAVESAFRHKSHYLMVLRDGQICGIVPLMEANSWLFGHSLVSVPFGVYGGVLSDDEEARLALVERAEQLARKLAVDYLELRQLNLSGEPSVSSAGWLKKDLYVTFRRPIYPTVEENLLAIPRKQRAMVRKGENWGFEATDLDYNFYLVKRENMPNVSPVNPKYSRMINAWKMPPLVVTNWLGPMLVRSIP